MIAHIEEAKAALLDQRVRVFTEDKIWQICRAVGMVLPKGQHSASVLKVLGFKSALIQSPYEKHTFYYWPEATVYELGQALKPRAYIAQLGALGFHGLAPEPLRHLVINEEQSAKPQSKSSLSQSAIDNAFKGKPRISNNVGIWKQKGHETFFYLTNSKHTKNAGVNEAACGPSTIRVTNVPRTLLDCTVRAFYGGGPELILHAFRLAAEKHDVADLVHEITQLTAHVSHKYPYHQALGFYFQTACPHLPSKTWEPLREAGMNFKFHLTYQMKEPLFDERWQIYYPHNLK